MIKLIISIFVFLVSIVNIDGVVYAVDSGVSIGVNVTSIGPPTINDFDYSNLSNSLKLENKFTSNTNSGLLSEEKFEINSQETPNNNLNIGPNSTTTVISSNVNTNAANENLVTDQGVVLGAKIRTNQSWVRSFLIKCSNFFKKIF